MRPSAWHIGAPLALVAAILAFAGAIFGLNGPNWKWWQSLSWAAAVTALGCAAGVLTLRRRMQLRSRALGHGLLAAGLTATVVAIGVAGNRFNDSYDGSQIWPHLLAVVAFAGVLTCEIGVVALALRRR